VISIPKNWQKVTRQQKIDAATELVLREIESKLNHHDFNTRRGYQMRKYGQDEGVTFTNEFNDIINIDISKFSKRQPN
jgi:hypothetical protein